LPGSEFNPATVKKSGFQGLETTRGGFPGIGQTKPATFQGVEYYIGFFPSLGKRKANAGCRTVVPTEKLGSARL
jgi:hypothetical protein